MSAVSTIVDPRRERAGFLSAAWLRSTKRSWWQARFDRRVSLSIPGHPTLVAAEISEWQTLRDPSDPESSRWQDVPRRGLRTLRILCPNGEVGEVISERYDNRLFQLRQVAFVPGMGRGTQLAHLIGVVHDDRGNADVMVWEPPYAKLDALARPSGTVPGRLIGPFGDNVLNMRYGGIGPLGLESLRLVL